LGAALQADGETRSVVTPAALAVRFNAGPQFSAYTVVSCSQLADDTIIAIAPEAIATGFSGLPTVDIAKETVMHFEDTTPLNITAAAVAATVKSTWQSNFLALRLRLELAYGPLAPGVVQVINSVTW
jgi:hypothetical protein